MANLYRKTLTMSLHQCSSNASVTRKNALSKKAKSNALKSLRQLVRIMRLIRSKIKSLGNKIH